MHSHQQHLLSSDQRSKRPVGTSRHAHPAVVERERLQYRVHSPLPPARSTSLHGFIRCRAVRAPRQQPSGTQNVAQHSDRTHALRLARLSLPLPVVLFGASVVQLHSAKRHLVYRIDQLANVFLIRVEPSSYSGSVSSHSPATSTHG